MFTLFCLRYHVAQTGLELAMQLRITLNMILLPLQPELWDYRYVPLRIKHGLCTSYASNSAASLFCFVICLILLRDSETMHFLMSSVQAINKKCFKNF